MKRKSVLKKKVSLRGDSVDSGWLRVIIFKSNLLQADLQIQAAKFIYLF